MVYPLFNLLFWFAYKRSSKERQLPQTRPLLFRFPLRVVLVAVRKTGYRKKRKEARHASIGPAIDVAGDDDALERTPATLWAIASTSATLLWEYVPQ